VKSISISKRLQYLTKYEKPKKAIVVFIAFFTFCLLVITLIGHISNTGGVINMKKIYLLMTLLVVQGAFAESGDKPIENRPGLSLRETFDLYVKAVQNSDLKGLFTTVTDSDEFFFLTADGKLLNRDEYYSFHRKWFADADWEMPVELLTLKEGKDCGYTNAIFYYRSKLPGGGTYNLESYFTLIFRKEDEMWKLAADVCTPIYRYISEPDAALKYDMDQEYLFRTIKERRTVRKYKPTPVPDEHIKKILDTARFAPTAGNQQPWKFLVIRDRNKLDGLEQQASGWYLDLYKSKKSPSQEELESTSAAVKEILDDVLSAPVYVAVLVDGKAIYPDYILHDGALASGYLMIAARALGYGTGYFTTFFPEKQMKEFFAIPDQYKLICFTPIGVPDQWPETPAKKELEEMIVFESF
jgi:nitroreductase/ketosteroid isomerase-like protein